MNRPAARRSVIAATCVLALLGEAAHAAQCTVPTAAKAVSTATPDHVIGNGTPASCTSAAVVDAVAQGGKVRFNCGPNAITIVMKETAKVYNDQPDLVLDGGGKVTLSGGGVRRILYQNTCDPNQVWTSSRCDLQTNPKTTIQNLTFVDGNAIGQRYGRTDVYGGGAIFVRGGGFKIVNSVFMRNRCEATGPDMGGGAVRAFGTQGVFHITGSRFGGDSAAKGNTCSNGGGLSGLGASFGVWNSVFRFNDVTGYGANPARAGTPGGGSGGAIYMDGNSMNLNLCGTRITDHAAPEGGSAVFYVSNNRTGTMQVTNATMKRNPKGRFETAGLPGMFVLAAPGQPVVTNSTIAP